LHCDATQQFTVDAFTGQGATCTVIVDARAAAACPARYTPVVTSLGGAYIALAAAVVVVAAYLLGGMAYKRVMLGASGFESVPNIDTWRYVARCLCGRCCGGAQNMGYTAAEPTPYESLELPGDAAPTAPGFVTVKG